ncbi:MAG: SpoIVB peptidase [Roseburia sp.]
MRKLISYGAMIVVITGMICVGILATVTFEQAIPDQMYVAIGEEISYDFGVPVSVVLKEQETEVFENISETVAGIQKEQPVTYTVVCKLFGILSVKEVEVTLTEAEALYTGGTPIGIYVRTDGILIIGTGAITDQTGNEKNPAEYLVKAGDYIETVNGEEVTTKEELITKINEYGGEKEILGIRRGTEQIEVTVEPVQTRNGEYKLGIWVRDDLAGVGTLTYYKSDGEYGALGHGVSDADTGVQMEIAEGSIYETQIIGIQKGLDGRPGEISGVIHYGDSAYLGSIEWNHSVGIHGDLDGNLNLLGESSCCEVAYKQEIECGPAYLISGISGENRTYEIEIEEVNFDGNAENKGILFQVKDEELLELTGGIVQGMSGSPIIQNGKIIGAVTHVFINNPTKGYGIFIENMLQDNSGKKES